MSDKENTTAVPQADAATPQPAAAPAGPTISSEDRITVINQFNLQVNAPERQGNGGGGQRRASRGTANPIHAPVRSNGNGRASAPPAPANPSNSASASSGTLESSGVARSYDSEGNLQRTISDGLGGRVILTTDDGVTSVMYSDSNGLLRTRSDRGGFTEFATERYTEAGEPRTRSTINRATEGLDGIYGLRPDVSCGGRATVASTNAVVDSVTRNEIQEFLNRHPSIKETLRNLNLPIVELNGRPATTASVLSQSSSFHACPVGRPNLTVERVH